MTLLDALIQSVTRAGEYNRDDQVAPAVILWPDKESPVLLTTELVLFCSPRDTAG